MLIFFKKMYFIDKKLHLIGFQSFFLFTFSKSKSNFPYGQLHHYPRPILGANVIL